MAIFLAVDSLGSGEYAAEELVVRVPVRQMGVAPKRVELDQSVDDCEVAELDVVD